MFGFTGADSAETVVRKREHMTEAQARWPFFMHFDAPNIKNARQLITLVKDRSSKSQDQAEADVHRWMEGKAF